MRSMIRTLIGAATCALAYGSQEPAAAACDDAPSLSPLASVGLVTAGIVSAGTFGYADAAYASDGHHLPPAWAWSQLALAGLPWTYAGIRFTQGALSGCDSHPPLALGLGATAVGLWFTGDAIYSLLAPASAAQVSGRRYRPPIALGVIRNHELTYATVGVTF